MQNTTDINDDGHGVGNLFSFLGTKALDLVLQELGRFQIDNRIPKSIKQGNLQQQIQRNTLEHFFPFGL